MHEPRMSLPRNVFETRKSRVVPMPRARQKPALQTDRPSNFQCVLLMDEVLAKLHNIASCASLQRPQNAWQVRCSCSKQKFLQHLNLQWHLVRPPTTFRILFALTPLAAYLDKSPVVGLNSVSRCVRLMSDVCRRESYTSSSDTSSSEALPPSEFLALMESLELLSPESEPDDSELLPCGLPNTPSIVRQLLFWSPLPPKHTSLKQSSPMLFNFSCM